MKNHYDVVIIGSGPAGSTAGYLLGQDNVDTLLIEKRTLPRHKTCGGGLTDKTMRLVKRVFGHTPPALRRRNILNSSTVDWRVGFREQTLKSFQSRDDVYFTDRKEYDHFLFREAESTGIDTLIGDGVTGVNFAESTLETESGESVSFGHLMAADGVHSPTRKALMDAGEIQCPHWFDQLAIALEAYVPRDRAPENFSESGWLDLHLGVVNWGYGWVFPHDDKLLVGVGGLKTENPDIRSNLLNYGKLLGFDLRDVKIKGHPIPFGNYIKIPYHGNVLLLGDAGGFVDPITGEGIFYAQRTGELAANAYRSGTEETTGQRYTELVNEHVIPEMTGSWRIRPMVYGGPRGLRRRLFSLAGQRFGAGPILDIVHGHRVWHNFTRTGEKLHDTIAAG